MSTPDRRLAAFLHPMQLLRLSGLGICLLNGAGALLEALGVMPADGTSLLALIWRALFGPQVPLRALSTAQLLLAVVFATSYWHMTRPRVLAQRGLQRLWPLLGLSALAAWLSPLPFIVTALAAIVLPARAALGFLAVQVAVTWTFSVLVPSPEEVASWAETGLPVWLGDLSLLIALAALYGMAFSLGRMVADEADKRRLLQTANAELASQHRLQAEQVRFAERLQMTRDLHDLMGHHLAALNLSLQLASELQTRQEFERAREPLHRAREAAQRLLDDVRATVSATREARRIDLTDALRELAARIDTPRIEMQIDDTARDLPPRVADAALRCVQEAVTNTVRHARAQQMRVRVSCRAGQLAIVAADDGIGAPQLVFGSGLAGMRERLVELGGELRVNRTQPGFEIEMSLPCET